MAKPFYSLEEVCQALGKSQDQVRGMVRDGTLREFRDAGKVFFKAEDVDRLSGKGGKSGDTGEIVLEASDSHLGGGLEDSLPSLADSGGGTSLIGLEPIEEEPEKKKDDTVITTSGIGVFEEDEVEVDDPMAKTHITTGRTADDQVSLEGTGSGSGLLDLTREADDTSLGAELLDEIYPGEDDAAPAAPAKKTPPPPKTKAPPKAEEPDEAELAAPVEAPVVIAVAAGDPMEGLLGGLLVGALIMLGMGATVVAGALQGFLPDYAEYLSNNFLIFLGAAVGVVGISLAAGFFVGKAAGPRRA
ncbi:Helix-turn-helix domain protein [Phycisphaerae bacterium RAS1]|nr:Helix-turn-helix domain protein [Phycisphaerae bacterium RAS1]